MFNKFYSFLKSPYSFYLFILIRTLTFYPYETGCVDIIPSDPQKIEQPDNPKIVQIVIKLPPNFFSEYTNWNIFISHNLNHYLYITILWLPLLFAIYVFYLYLYQYYSTFAFGSFYNIEDKFINF